MKKEGVDLSESVRTQLTPEMVKKSDKIIVMVEPETVPKYLLKNNKVQFWDIENPKGMDDDGYKKIISQIKSEIQKFVSSHTKP